MKTRFSTDVTAKHKDTQIEVKAIKDFLLEIAGTTLTPSKYEDDAKKGEEDCMRKLTSLVKKAEKKPDIAALKKARQEEIAKEMENKIRGVQGKLI